MVAFMRSMQINKRSLSCVSATTRVMSHTMSHSLLCITYYYHALLSYVSRDSIAQKRSALLQSEYKNAADF